MEKNTIIAIVLSCIVMAASFFIQTKFFPPAEQMPVQTEETVASEQENQQNIQNTAEKEILSAVSAVVSEDEENEKAEKAAEQTFTIKTNLVEAVFTNREVFVMEMLIETCVRFSFSSW